MRDAIPWALVVALLWVAIQGQCAERELDRTREALAELRTDELQARTEAQGWRTQLVQATSEMEAEIQAERDRGALLEEEKAALAREVETLGARLTLVTDLYAEARGQIIAHAESHGTEEAPDSITAPLDDGLLSGRVAYLPGPEVFDLAYTARVSGSLVTAEAPDGRTLVSAMASDPRVTLGFGEVYVAAPRVVQQCGIGQQVRSAAYGAVGWELARILIRSITP